MEDDLSKLISGNWLSSNPFKPGKGNEALLAIIKQEIRDKGPISFARFMQLALFHPEYGYYNAALQRIGAKGDYLTSPETHPIFGALIARQLEQMWQLIGAPRVFTVVEMGAGAGSLCHDILTFSKKAYPGSFNKALRYVIIESSPDFVARQKELFATARLSKTKLTWVSSLDDLPAGNVDGCFISNELPDAFPVHRVVKESGVLREVYVGLDGRDELMEVVDEPSSALLENYFAWIGVSLPEGCQGEVNLMSLDWTRRIGLSLRKGFAITIDYGHPAAELYTTKRPRGTLLCYYMHTYNENPYLRVGQQDITAHVDFTALELAGQEVGLAVTGLIRQDEFLLNLGISRYARALKHASLETSERQKNLLAAEDLVQPDDLGRLRVLIHHKGIERPSLLGLSTDEADSDATWQFPLPLLPVIPCPSKDLSWLL